MQLSKDMMVRLYRVVSHGHLLVFKAAQHREAQIAKRARDLFGTFRGDTKGYDGSENNGGIQDNDYNEWRLKWMEENGRGEEGCGKEEVSR